jgi:DnaJ-class molecular chaperone
MTNPYTVLGVSPSATQAEITHAYCRRLRDHHPDLHTSQPHPDADEQLRRILSAYTILRDPHRRASYDRAHPISTTGRPVRIIVTHNASTDDQPPLSAGPVRWQPNPGQQR